MCSFTEKINLLTLGLLRLQYEALIQTFFDYACSFQYPNLSKRLIKKQSSNYVKLIHLFLPSAIQESLHFSQRLIQWSVNIRLNQFINSEDFKYFNIQFPYFPNENIENAYQNSLNKRNTCLKLEFPFHRTNKGQNPHLLISLLVQNSNPVVLKKRAN